jgi:hypothetical protein
MIPEDKNTNDRPEAYPKPTETDMQLNNQPEYSEVQPNSFTDNEAAPVTKEGSENNTSGKDKTTNSDRTRNT